MLSSVYEPNVFNDIYTTLSQQINDRRFDDHRWAELPSLNSAVDRVADAIEALEGRIRRRTEAEAFRFRAAVRVLLLNLYTVWTFHHATKLGISLDANA